MQLWRYFEGWDVLNADVEEGAEAEWWYAVNWEKWEERCWDRREYRQIVNCDLSVIWRIQQMEIG